MVSILGSSRRHARPLLTAGRFAKAVGLVLLSALSPFVLTVPVRAEACGPPAPQAILDMTPLPGSARMTVPVKVNDTTRHFLLATGAGSVSLNTAAGEALGLRPIYDENQTLLDFNGYASHRYFTLDSFIIGNFGGKNVRVRDTPDPHAGVNPPFDGVLAADLLYAFDVEMDFAAQSLIFFSQDHCPGQVVHWPAAAIGVVPITLRDRSQDANLAMSHGRSTSLSTEITGKFVLPPVIGVDIRTTVVLDGKSFDANIDTGQEISSLNTETARTAYDVTADTPGSAPVHPLDADAPAPKAGGISPTETVIVYGEDGDFQHSFHTLTFGDVTVHNPLFLVRPDRTGSHNSSNVQRTESHINRVDDFPRPPITIGMNVLRQLHLYFAFKEGKLYLTTAAPSAVN